MQQTLGIPKLAGDQAGHGVVFVLNQEELVQNEPQVPH